jgi:aminopeptidase
MGERRAELVERLAELAVDGGANVQPGQIVAVGTEPGKEALSRAIAVAAYKRGAKFVDVSTFDQHVKHARIKFAREEDLDYVPPWYGDRVRALGEQHAARIGLTGPSAPGLFADLDPARLARDPLPFLREGVEVVNKMLTNWTAVPCPTPAWAELVHGDAPDAFDRLWEDVARVCRLDEPDPSAAWRARAEQLGATAGRLRSLGLRSLRFRGDGTDLRVGLLEGSVWLGGSLETSWGLVHVPNLPTEEVFTTPDPASVEGFVRSTKPLVIGGTTVRGLCVRFEGGRAVEVTADEGGDVLAAMVQRDEGAARLGEVALVDRESRVGQLDTVFYDTLLDENAASHIALGSSYSAAVEGPSAERANDSAIHVDFMIGGTDVEVTGETASGAEVGVLSGGAWQLP